MDSFSFTFFSITIYAQPHTQPHAQSAYSCAACLLMRSLLTHAQPAYSCAACLLMRSLLTHAQPTYSCAACLLMHSLLTHAQPHCTVYKDTVDTPIL
jgi:hypothetical protein